MKPAVLPTIYYYRNDKFRSSIQFGPISDELGAPPDSPIGSARMQIKDLKTGVLEYELVYPPTLGKGTITIVNATTYNVLVPSGQTMPLEEGTKEYDIETFTTADWTGGGDTWVKGLIKVEKDV
jgi:hypothetical protein